ncbi:MAG TPA: carbon monoxide dehydrogenase subunit G [Woeseiaceae bacterium]|nr:carbon monoxide dehydrogenase subunit G [Woeseiaceae bacterium]
MDIKGEYRIACERQSVWQALNDAEVLARCIPGCESIEMQGPTRLKARILATIGPVRSKFDTQISLENLNPPFGYTLTGESKGGPAGFARGSADVRLEERDGGTLLVYDAKFQVGGKLAQIGSRLVLGATRKLADDFFGNFSRELDPGAQRGSEIGITMEQVPERARGMLLAVALVVVALLIWWFLIR